MTTQTLLTALIAGVMATSAGDLAQTMKAAESGDEAGGDELARGSFEGRTGHETSGTAVVTQRGNRFVLILAEDFRLDGAPDPKVAFGNDGYDSETQFAHLKSLQGKQEYELPAGLDPSDYNEVWIWCEKFSVPLGVARLSQTS